MVLCIRPRRFRIGPGLSVLVFLEGFGDLFPSLIVAGPVITTIQSTCGQAKRSNNETSHRRSSGYKKLTGLNVAING
jgi:hypothetical protein